jgi:predicted HicB family RNase H-like nuclease
METKSINIALPIEIHHKLKLLAYAENITLKDLVINMITKEVNNKNIQVVSNLTNNN